MGLFTRRRSKDVADVLPMQRTGPSRATGPTVDIDVVGEAAYQPHIRRLMKVYGDVEFEVVLRADPSNRYDANAVAVYADGAIVGFLPRSMAASWQPAVLDAERRGLAVIGIAQIFGGTEDKPHLGVFGRATWPGDGQPVDRWHA